MPRVLLLTGCALCALLQPACSNRAWYEGFRETRREQCYQQPSQSQIDRCLEEVTSDTYDTYRRSQEGPGPVRN